LSAGLIALRRAREDGSWVPYIGTELPKACASAALNDLAWGRILPGFAVVLVLGVVMLVLNG